MNVKNLRYLMLIGASALLLSGCNLNTKQNVSNTQSTDQGQSSVAPNVAEEANVVVITYSESGFSPVSTSAKVGQKLVFKNTGSQGVQVNSAPHPSHNLYPELNLGMINAGESKSLTFTTTGDRKYHNHLNVSQNGQITVE